MQETWVQSLGQEDPLEEAMTTHSSIFARKIPWTEKPGGLQSMGSQRVRHNWTTEHACCNYKTFYVIPRVTTPWSREWQPTPVFLPCFVAWTKKPGRLWSRGSQRAGHDWATNTHTKSNYEENTYRKCTPKWGGNQSMPLQKINERRKKASREEKKDKITTRQTENSEQNGSSEPFPLRSYSKCIWIKLTQLIDIKGWMDKKMRPNLMLSTQDLF